MEFRLYEPKQGDIFTVSYQSVINHKDAKYDKFIESYKNKIIVTDTKNTYTLGIIREVIIEKYKFKDVIIAVKDLFRITFGFIFRNIKLKYIKIEKL
jgi:hypothetical protein